jgi:hypothetical protein
MAERQDNSGPGPRAAERKQRLAEELRSNLLKRKALAKARANRTDDGPAPPEPGPPKVG